MSDTPPAPTTAPPAAAAAADARAADQRRLVGVACALGAFLLWGFAPIYFKAVAAVPPLEVLAHRVVWTVVLLGLVLALLGRSTLFVTELRRLNRLWIYLLSTTLIAGNWLVFIWAVANDHLLQASLGYYINPLVTIALGVIFLAERLNRWQWAAVGLATAGVAVLIVGYGEVPWVSLALAFSFGFYSLIRKRFGVDPLVGLQIETLLLVPLGLVYLAAAGLGGTGSFVSGGWTLSLLLLASGLVTASPLILFMYGAQRLTLSTIGIMQYLAPSLHFVLAVAVYGEVLSEGHLVTFAAIWLGLACYTGDAMVRRRGGLA